MATAKIDLERIVVLVLVGFFSFTCGCGKMEEVDRHQREACLKLTLNFMREAIDQYTRDHNRAPQDLNELVKARYFREIPKDPITGSANTWQVVLEDVLSAQDQQEPGITDVHSGSRHVSSEGTSYDTW